VRHRLQWWEKVIVERKAKFILIIAATLGALVLAGFVGVSYKDENVASQYPNDRANHHPLHPNG
jgi:hypothetical protein